MESCIRMNGEGERPAPELGMEQEISGAESTNFGTENCASQNKKCRFLRYFAFLDRHLAMCAKLCIFVAGLR